MADNPITTSTKLADVIVPELFTQYVIEKTAEKSRLIQSGIAMVNPKLNELVTAGGLTMHMPFWGDLSGEDEVLADNESLTPGKISAKQDVAALLLRGKAWGANDLAGALAGSDPMAAIADRVSDYWARQEQKTLLAILKGIFASTEFKKNHLLELNTKGISPEVILDAKQKLGDSADQLQAIMMHSAVFTQLQKANVITYVTSNVGQSGSPIQIPQYLGYDIIIDDGMPVNDGVYTTYLFARGSIGRGEGTPVSMVMTETDRDSLAGEDFLINRRAFVLHPFGISWNGTVESTNGKTPSNSELETGTNWKQVYEDKNIGLVAVTHKLVDDPE